MSYSPSYTDLFSPCHLLHVRNGALAHECDGSGWERTPWRAVQVAGWQALRNASAEKEGGR